MFQEAEFWEEPPSFVDKHSMSREFSMAVFWKEDRSKL